MLERLFGEEREKTPREQLIYALHDLQSRLSAARREFELVDEPELIDALTYEILSLSRRENTVIKRIKELGNE